MAETSAYEGGGGAREPWESRGAGYSGDHSAWEGYNAVAESVDPDDAVWRVQDSRVEALVDGTFLGFKGRVLSVLDAAPLPWPVKEYANARP